LTPGLPARFVLLDLTVRKLGVYCYSSVVTCSAASMFIRIETSSGVPITRQIMDQIRAHCAAGALAPGERLPSVRALARELAVNQNTILRVYERLTSEGLLERRHGDGTYVAQDLAPGRLRAQRDLLRQEVDRLVRRAATLGVDAPAIHAMVDKAFDRAPGTASSQKGEQNG
jgi:GntR family transcriptional regulator